MNRHLSAAIAGGAGAALCGIVSCTAHSEPLSPAVFATLLATCAPDAPGDYMQRIARHESGFSPYALHDNTSGASVFPETRERAVAAAREILRSGHSLDAGLLQINVSNWRWLGLTVETALDPCENVRAGARVFEAMSRYNTGDPRKGFANQYVQRVIAEAPTPGPQGHAAQQEAHKDDDTDGDDPSLTVTFGEK